MVNNYTVTRNRGFMSSASIQETLMGKESGSYGDEQKNLGFCCLGKMYMLGKMLFITL